MSLVTGKRKFDRIIWKGDNTESRGAWEMNVYNELEDLGP